MFEKRCVVCLDILGFTNLIQRAEIEPAEMLKLEGLRTVLDAHVIWDNLTAHPSVPDTHVPKYLFISDTIIISTPADSMGARAAIVKSVQIYQKVLESGYLLRGAMVVGNAWHDNRNIFGTGWIAAYNAEAKDSFYPRILVSSEVVGLLDVELQNAMLIRDLDGRWMCDVFHPSYIREAQLHGGTENFYRQVRAWITTSIGLLNVDSSARSKWEWEREFFQKAIARHGYMLDQL